MFKHFRGEVLLFQITAILLTLLVAAPLVTLVLGSLSSSHEAYTGELGLGNFERLLTQSRYLTALWNTLRIAVASTVIATVVGVTLAWLVGRTDIPGRWLVHLGVVAPFFMSPFIGALAWGLLLSPKIGILNQFIGIFGIPPFGIYTVGGIIWVMGIYYAPYVYMFVQSALYNLDPTLEEAAFMSGLSPWLTVLKVTLPLVLPAIMSGMLLTFVAAVGQFGVPSLLGTPSRINVMTTYIYDLTNTTPSHFNLAAAMSVILLAIACIALYAQHRVMRGRSYVTVSGKSTRPKTLKLGVARVPATAFAYLFLLFSSVLPLLMLAYVSFVPYYSGNISFAHLTLRHYISLVRDNQIAERAFINTIIVSIGSACAAVMLGVVISWIQMRTRAWYRGAISMALVLPVAIPGIVLGLAIMWTWIYVPIHVYGTTWLLFIGYLTGYLPFAVRSVTAVHQQIDRSLEEAVSMVGGGWLTTMRHVTLPLLKPGIAAGWTLLFIVFVRELAISILLYAPGGEVLSVLIYNRWSEGDYNALAAMAMIQVVLMMIVIVLIRRVFKIDLSRGAG